MTEAWDRLAAELDRWKTLGRQPHFWLRDDDAVADTPALRRLMDWCGAHSAAACLAVIPAKVERGLVAMLQEALPTDVRILVHGFSHSNHEAAENKKCEFGLARDLNLVAADAARGISESRSLMGDRMLPVMVPPWNRMREDLVPVLSSLGFAGVSTFGRQRFGGMGLVEVNTHVDLMDWRRREGREAAAVIAEVATLLAARREGAAEGPIGVLSHHLVHDGAAWAALEAIASAVAGQGSWLSGQELFATNAAGLS